MEVLYTLTAFPVAVTTDSVLIKGGVRISGCPDKGGSLYNNVIIIIIIIDEVVDVTNF